LIREFEAILAIDINTIGIPKSICQQIDREFASDCKRSGHIIICSSSSSGSLNLPQIQFNFSQTSSTIIRSDHYIMRSKPEMTFNGIVQNNISTILLKLDCRSDERFLLGIPLFETMKLHLDVQNNRLQIFNGDYTIIQDKSPTNSPILSKSPEDFKTLILSCLALVFISICVVFIAKRCKRQYSTFSPRFLVWKKIKNEVSSPSPTPTKYAGKLHYRQTPRESKKFNKHATNYESIC
jgi:hypothetical protein